MASIVASVYYACLMVETFLFQKYNTKFVMTVGLKNFTRLKEIQEFV